LEDGRLTGVVWTVVSALLLAAHFFRSGHWLLVAVALLLPWLLRVRAAWGRRILQMCLLLGAAEWLRTGFVFVQERRLAGAPWLRLALILGAVALCTAGAAWAVRPRGPLGRGSALDRAP
jgi:hypothetical protein